MINDRDSTLTDAQVEAGNNINEAFTKGWNDGVTLAAADIATYANKLLRDGGEPTDVISIANRLADMALALLAKRRQLQ